MLYNHLLFSQKVRMGNLAVKKVTAVRAIVMLLKPAIGATTNMKKNGMISIEISLLLICWKETMSKGKKCQNYQYQMIAETEDS